MMTSRSFASQAGLNMKILSLEIHSYLVHSQYANKVAVMGTVWDQMYVYVKLDGKNLKS